MASGFVAKGMRWRCPDTVFVLYSYGLDFIGYAGAIPQNWQVKALGMFQKRNYYSRVKNPKDKAQESRVIENQKRVVRIKHWRCKYYGDVSIIQ